MDALSLSVLLALMPGVIVCWPLLLRPLGRRWPSSGVIAVAEVVSLYSAFNVSLVAMWGVLSLVESWGFMLLITWLLLQPIGVAWSLQVASEVRRNDRARHKPVPPND